MQRRIFALIAISVLAVALAACGSSSKKSSGSTATAPAGTITIKGLAFTGTTVKAGATVTVENQETNGTTHTVKSDDGTSFDTGNIEAGKTATFTAPTKPGSYPFHCNIHTFMKGTLTVTA